MAGLSIPSKIPTTEVSVYETIMDVNVKGAFLTGKYFAQHAAKPAIIVNIGSTAAKTANANAPLYCTAKAAVNMLWGSRTVDKSELMQAEDVVEIITFALTSSPRVQIHDIYFESSARF